MTKIQIYAYGLVYCSVCAPKTMSREDIEEEVNASSPTGISSSWKISKDEFFKGDTRKNGCDCEDDDSRRHWLMVC